MPDSREGEAGINKPSAQSDIERGDEKEETRAPGDKCRALINNANIAILLIDSRGNLLEANKKAEELTGYTQEELLNLNTSQQHQEKELAIIIASIKDESRKNPSFSYSTLLPRKDGTTIPVEIRGSLTTYADEEICLSMITDITEQQKTEQALRASRDWAEHIFRLVPSAIFTVDPKGNITSFNKQAEDITGYSAEQVIGKNCTVFAMPPCSTKCGLFQCELDEPIIGKICTIRKKDGELLTASKNLDLLRDEQGKIVGGVESFEDITRRKLAEEALKASEERYRTLAEAAHDMIFILDRDGYITYVNTCAAESLGLKRDDVVGKLIRDLFPPAAAERQKTNLDKVFKSGESFYSEETMTSSRGELWIGTRLTPISNEAGEISAVLGISRDITERKKSEEMIRYMAYYDSLTDLPNRMFFTEQLNSAITLAQRNQEMMAVIFLDLDNFKTVNDTLGHCAGDQLLQDVGGRLKACLRESDFIARFGGDEFVLLLTQIDCAKDASQVAQKIFEAMKPPFDLDGHEFHITTSIGISLYPNDGQDARFLLKNADAALYHAKEQGRNNHQLYSACLGAKAS
ncbi:MAG: PAS domain S-box protein [Candidatus Aquicultor sp.]|nr:PAS domain S-box protein [Candidatus Aquicultor sp.]